MKRIDILDSLRGVAAGLVAFHHWWIAYTRTTDTTLGKIGHYLSDLNYLAVLFFFCLSGFSIGIKYFQFGSRNEVKRFIIRRFKRILPVTYLALLISFVLRPELFNLFDLLGNLLFLQTPASTQLWFSPFCGNGPLWSLSYEMWFYLLFPFLLLQISRFSRRPARWLLLAVWPLGLIAVFMNNLIPTPWSQFLSLLPVWVIGWALAQLWFKRLQASIHLIVAFVVLAFSLLLTHYFLFPSATIFSWGAGIFIGFILFAAVKAEDSGHLQSSGFLQWLGDGSFSMYAFHYPVLSYLTSEGWEASQSAMALAVLFISLPAAERFIVRAMAPL